MKALVTTINLGSYDATSTVPDLDCEKTLTDAQLRKWARAVIALAKEMDQIGRVVKLNVMYNEEPEQMVILTATMPETIEVLADVVF